MSLPRTSYHVPAETARVAHACFPMGNPYLHLLITQGVFDAAHDGVI